MHFEFVTKARNLKISDFAAGWGKRQGRFYAPLDFVNPVALALLVLHDAIKTPC